MLFIGGNSAQGGSGAGAPPLTLPFPAGTAVGDLIILTLAGGTTAWIPGTFAIIASDSSNVIATKHVETGETGVTLVRPGGFPPTFTWGFVIYRGIPAYQAFAHSGTVSGGTNTESAPGGGPAICVIATFNNECDWTVPAVEDYAQESGSAVGSFFVASNPAGASFTFHPFGTGSATYLAAILGVLTGGGLSMLL